MKALTGKAKEDFNRWINNNGYHEEVIYNSVINALIIEWLDSVGIRITVSYWSYTYKWQDIILGLINGNFEHNSRQQATEKAIEKAIEIYNNRGN